jgi:WD40 repeat protein
VCVLQFSKDGNYLFSGDNSGNIIMWNVKTKKKPHTSNVIDFRIYKNAIISCSFNGDVVFTNISTPKEKKHKSSGNMKLLLD